MLAPVHAWRALGQLRSEAAITPFIANFDRLCSHDVALIELPKAIGMISTAAIPALAQHMQQFDTDEFSRVMAVDALCEVAQQHKAASYKLGLLHTLIRIAEGVPGMVTRRTDTIIQKSNFGEQ